MKYCFLYLLLFLCASGKLLAGDSLILKRSIVLNSKLFTTDPVGNVYVVKENNILVKYSPQGDSLGFFNEIKKGKITQIDATNPLKVLVYLADYGNILVLDNVLSLKSTLRLTGLGLINVPCIAGSADGNIWAFDPAGMLVKINDKPEIHQTTSLRNVLKEAIDPVFMVEQDRALYIVDTLEGIKKFDLFGFYKTSYPFVTKEIQYFNDYLVYFDPPFLVSYNTLSLREKKLQIPYPEDIIKVRVERNMLYVLRKEGLDFYSLEGIN